MISAAIIVKNGDKYLDGCLDSLSELEEVVVFDNGEVPTEHQVRENEVYKHLPISAPMNVLRNMCVNLCNGDLVFQVDVDERLVGRLPQLPLGIYSVPVQGISPTFSGGRGLFKKDLLRIFPKTRYKGDIHEYPVLSGTITRLKGLYLSNLGYDVPLKEFREKVLDYHKRIEQSLLIEEDYVLLRHLKKSYGLMGMAVPEIVDVKINAKKEHFDWFKGR